MADLKKDSLPASTTPNKPRNNFLAQPKLAKATFQNNPFRKLEGEEDNGERESLNLFAPRSPGKDKKTNDEKTTSSSDDKKCEDIVPKFVPLHSSRDSISFAGGTANAPKFSSATNFVFGQNLKERILSGPDDNNGESSANSNSEHVATNGTSNTLFSVVQPNNDNHTAPKTESNSLAQSAQTWERIRESSMPSLPPPQQVFTGEEGETNQLQLNCRVFAFESGIWKERGRGQLRLNDGHSCSRLVCRSSGSLRIMLNTKIWAGMTVERPGNKSLRITATDSQQQLKVFLIMANPDEISHLHDMLSRRVTLAEKLSRKRENSSSDTTTKSDNGIEEASKTELPEESHSPKSLNADEDEHSVKDTETTDILPLRSANNPVVVVSNEDEVDKNIRDNLKRPTPDESNSVPKKMCMELPSEDNASL